MTPDLFGLEPVYRSDSGQSGMDPRALTANRTVDDEALAGYLAFSHVPTPRTIFADVARLSRALPLPGAFVSHGRPSSAAEEGAKGYAAGDAEREVRGENLQTLLRDAVRSRLTTADLPVGVYLSGGLDSSVVASLLVEAGAKVTAYTLDFGPGLSEEIPLAEAVATQLKIPLRKVSCREVDVSRAWDAAAAALPQPFGDPVCVPLYLLGKAAKAEVGEIWNGEGGDQLFGGWANKPLIAAQVFGASDLTSVYLDTYHRFHGRLGALWPGHPNVSLEGWIAPALSALPPDNPLMHRLRMANVLLKGAQNIAPRCVALGACHGLKVVAPLFDAPLLDATFNLPPEAFLSGACEKVALKEAARRWLPERIVYREKRGMGVPSAEWLLGRGMLGRRGPVGRRAAAALSEKKLRREGRFDPAFVKNLLDGSDPTAAGFRRRRAGEKLWTLAMWEVWREVHSL